MTEIMHYFVKIMNGTHISRTCKTAVTVMYDVELK